MKLDGSSGADASADASGDASTVMDGSLPGDASIDAGSDESEAEQPIPDGGHDEPDANGPDDNADDDAGADFEPVVTTITGTGRVYGAVVTAANAPIAGALVLLEGSSSGPATTADDGAFAIGDLPLGSTKLTVSAAGYETRTISTAAANEGWYQQVVLIPRPADTIVSATGATVAAGAASLVFPAGAYGADTIVSAAWLSGPDLAASPGPLLFVDAAARAAVVLGVLHVAVAAEPNSEIAVELPVPDGVGVDDIALYALDPETGTWGNPVAASDLTGGVATFAVSHFSDHALVTIQAVDAEVVLSVTGVGASYLPEGANEAVAIVVGTQIPMNAQIDPGSQTVCSYGLRCGTAGNPCPQGVAPVAYQVCRTGGSSLLTREEGVPTQSALSAVKAVTRFMDPPSPTKGINKFFIRPAHYNDGMSNDGLGIRGTISTVKTYSCALEPTADVFEVEVDEGEVVLTVPNGMRAISAGQKTTVCPECSKGTCDPAVSLGAGQLEPFAVLASGNVASWNGWSSATGSFVVPWVSGVKRMTSNQNADCALLEDGEIACRGAGALGAGPPSGSYSSQAMVSGVRGAKSVSVGADHACALLASGQVACWGSNYYGQLGNGTTTDSWTPVTVTGLSGVTDLAVGVRHSCAALGSGQVACWGSNPGASFGSNYEYSTPVLLTRVSGVTDLQCRQDVYCGRIGNSGVVCWGDARHFGTFDQPYSFDLPGVSAIAEGNDHVCGIIADGEVACWGWNRDGQLGNGTQTDAYLPTKVPSVTGAISIAAGPTFTCVLLDTGRVSCWGQKFTDSSGSLLPMTLPW